MTIAAIRGLLLREEGMGGWRKKGRGGRKRGEGKGGKGGKGREVREGTKQFSFLRSSCAPSCEHGRRCLTPALIVCGEIKLCINKASKLQNQ